MTQEPRTATGFDERLLIELRRVVDERSRDERRTHRPPRRRSPRTVRGAAAAALVAAVAAALVVVPALRGERGGSPAYAVTTAADGTVTVEIRSIDEAEGLQAQLRDAGIRADVRLLPTGKLCDARATGAVEQPAPTVDTRFRQASSNRLDEAADGALVFTIDPAKLLPSETVVIQMQYAPPEHGQRADLVASVMMGIEVLPAGGYVCELVDGSVEGWPWQQGGPSAWSS